MRIRVEHNEVRLLENVTHRPRRAFRIRLEPPTRTIVGSEDCTGRGRIEGDRAVDLAAVSNEIRTGSKVRLAKWVHLLVLANRPLSGRRNRAFAAHETMPLRRSA